MRNWYWIESEDLWVGDGTRIIWRGRPGGSRPGRVMPLLGGDAIVQLAGVDAPRNPLGVQKTWANVIRVRPNGEVVWRADPVQTGGDFWVSFALRESGLHAWSWSCYHCELDLLTGRILSKVFTK